MKREPKPKQPIIGISLEPRELAEVKAICGNEAPGWVARQLLYRWVLAVREGRETVPARTTGLERLPRRPDLASSPGPSSPGAPPPSRPRRTGTG